MYNYLTFNAISLLTPKIYNLVVDLALSVIYIFNRKCSMVDLMLILWFYGWFKLIIDELLFINYG